MTDDNRVTGPPTLLDHLGLLWRRRWFVLVPPYSCPSGQYSSHRSRRLPTRPPRTFC